MEPEIVRRRNGEKLVEFIAESANHHKNGDETTAEGRDCIIYR
jgi:hypothetical protein